jgi:hypothetical protein
MGAIKPTPDTWQAHRRYLHLSLSLARPRAGRRENRSERRSADGNRLLLSLRLSVWLTGWLAVCVCVNQFGRNFSAQRDASQIWTGEGARAKNIQPPASPK